MEILGGLLVTICLWYAQSKSEKKVDKPQKKPDITVEIYDHRKRD